MQSIKHRCPGTLAAGQQPTKTGSRAIKKSTLDTAWQRMITAALEQGVIKKQERFSLHAMKRKGFTDTEGSAAEKR